MKYMQGTATRGRNEKRKTSTGTAKHHFVRLFVMLIVVIALASATTHALDPHLLGSTIPKSPPKTIQETKPAANTQQKTTASKPASTTTPAPVNNCAGNTLPQLALVSISQRHMWACDGSTTVYDSAVVTGMENLAADLTPTGTYHIYGKETDLYLKGSDSTGSWDDFVNYWMPFLDNQYGQYGFHDATWRPADAFGNISPYSSDASHGCVELPLATAKWLYGWAQIGTTVTIES
jgi:lipoprotein-anchoring transpeptidase ErfK/SrfK